MSLCRFVSIVLLATLITACGQKGPLILPDNDKPVKNNGKAVSTRPIATKPLKGDALSGKPLSGKTIETKPIDSKPISTEPYNVE